MERQYVDEFTTREAARVLGIHPRHMVAILDAGALPWHWAGDVRRIHVNDLLRYRAHLNGRK